MNDPRPEMTPEASAALQAQPLDQADQDSAIPAPADPALTDSAGSSGGLPPEMPPTAAAQKENSAASFREEDDEEELPLPSLASRPDPASEQQAEDNAGSAPPDGSGMPSGAGATSGDGGEPPLPPAQGASTTPSAAPAPAHSAGEEANDSTAPEDDEPMTLLGHLGELRRRMTRIVIAIILGFFACYSVSEPLYNWLLIPLKATLPANGHLTFLSPQGLFFVYMKLALLASVFLTSPFAFYQFWAFIAPGLYREEKRAILPLSLLSALFFLSGATFCYFMVFPVAFKFFMSFATDVIIPMISVDEYLSFVVKLLLAFGLVFEMPLFSYFLSKMGLITPEAMRRHRKYAVLVIFIVAAILTPPDVFSQCLMAAPMFVLYEVSVYVSALARKGRSAAKSAGDMDGKHSKDSIAKETEGSNHA